MFASWAFLAVCTAAHSQQSDSPPSSDSATSQEASAENEVSSGEASQPNKKEKPTKPWESAREEMTSGPDIYLLPDKDGKLRQVLGFRYEEFQQAWQQNDKNRRISPPLYTLEAVKVAGSADQSRVMLNINLEISPRTADWVGVPLQLPNLIVKNWDLDNKSDDECLVYDSGKKSYVLWLKSKPGTSRNLQLQGLIKLTRGSTSPGFEINLPYASRSNFVLQVPEAAAEFEVSPGIVHTTHETDTGGTEVRLKGQMSPLRLQWGTTDERNQAFNADVEAVGNLAIDVDRDRVHYDATFMINSFGRQIDRLRVQLPEKAVLTKESLTEAYRIVENAAQDGTVDILLSEPQSKPWELHLTAEHQREEDDPTRDESVCSATGFDVLSAFRQSGTVKLSVDDQLQAYFDLKDDIEQVPLENTQPTPTDQPVIAQFVYSRLPWELDVHTVARKQRVSVEPKCRLIVTQNQAELHLNLDYQFAGAYTSSVRIKMNGWEITDEPIKSGGVVNLDRIESKQQGLLVLPITNPKAERVPVSLVARREIKMGHLELPLPEPLHAFVLPGQLTVESEPSLRVTRSAVGTRGISIAAAANPTNDSTSSHLSHASAGVDTLELRTFLADAVLAADVAQREREVAVAVDTKIDVNLDKIDVKQQLQYEVKYQPITQLELSIPEPLWNNNSLKVRLDGEEVPIGLGVFSEEMPAEKNPTSAPVPATPATASEASPAAVKIRQLIVSLPRPMQSNFLLEIDYEQKFPELASEATTPTTLPLASPKDEIASNTVSIQTKKSIRATLDQTTDRGPWNIVPGAQDLETTALQMEGSGKPTTIPLFMQIEPEENTMRATLELAWLQTWIVDKLQQDRAVFRFRTSQPTVFAQLPSELLNPAIEVVLDGAPADYKLSRTNHLAVAIPEGQAFLPHTLEIRYQRSVKLSSWGSLLAELPRLESHTTTARVFWQLILPSSWHIASSPQQLSGEFWLGWLDYRWGRHPTHFQPELERLTGATSTPPPASSNQYLYRGFEIPREVDVLVVGKTWLVFTTTIMAFGIGMLLIYTPLLHNSLFWLALALALAGLVVISPAFIMLAVQSIFWAGLMTLAAVILRRLFVGDTQPYVFLDTGLESASTAVTAAWEPEAKSIELAKESQATSIQTGGSAS